jgi:carbonic anhydrase
MPPTAPLNIIKNTQNGNTCKLKCAYNFQYAPTNLQLLNQGSYLAMQVDNVNQPPVVYNDENYVVSEVRLYQPSIHTYGTNKVHASAELIIIHTNNQSAESMLVCVPIMVSTVTNTEASSLFDMILAEVIRTAPNKGNQTIYNNPSFNLGKFIPMKPYFSYSGTLAWEPENGSYDYIVFDIADAIQMTSTAYQILAGRNTTGVSIINGVIEANKIVALPETDNPDGVFYNASGPTANYSGGDSQIYIDCRPTGQSGEVLIPARTDLGGLLNIDSIKFAWNMDLLKLIVAAIIMYAVWRYSLKFFSSISVYASNMKGGSKK